MINERSKKMYRTSESFLFRIVPWFIGFVFALILSIWIISGILAFKSLDAINEKGLKGVVEQVWCGKDTDCKLPEVK